MRAVCVISTVALATAAAAARPGGPAPSEVASRLQSHYASVKDYECVMESEERAPDLEARPEDVALALAVSYPKRQRHLDLSGDGDARARTTPYHA